jgi:hypothetical protein
MAKMPFWLFVLVPKLARGLNLHCNLRSNFTETAGAVILNLFEGESFRQVCFDRDPLVRSGSVWDGEWGAQF